MAAQFKTILAAKTIRDDVFFREKKNDWRIFIVVLIGESMSFLSVKLVIPGTCLTLTFFTYKRFLKPML